ncbi:hypothetical protein [Bifidobacterium catulorum]|uniref:Uncharacterized protein n=1 Tax=Bifidobacterium catulorum TaxID=1630173 RepID=A0A2U2MQF8_9BIFI|nr:hypothetical protein [Bifidobacterium catulorum]PWG59073.1 hypothetical protein DF200_09535 [Bifidobacterium catulorum]
MSNPQNPINPQVPQNAQVPQNTQAPYAPQPPQGLHSPQPPQGWAPRPGYAAPQVPGPRPVPPNQGYWNQEPPQTAPEAAQADISDEKITRVSVILMVVFLGIDVLQSIPNLIPGFGDYTSIAARILIGFSPWTYLAFALAVYLLGERLAAPSRPEYATVGPVLLAVGAVARLVASIMGVFMVYNIINSLLLIVAYGMLLAIAVIILLAVLGKGSDAKTR